MPQTRLQVARPPSQIIVFLTQLVSPLQMLKLAKHLLFFLLCMNANCIYLVFLLLVKYNKTPDLVTWGCEGLLFIMFWCFKDKMINRSTMKRSTRLHFLGSSNIVSILGLRSGGQLRFRMFERRVLTTVALKHPFLKVFYNKRVNLLKSNI